ncbi:MAG: YdcF family protein [Bryobacterales bacterium]|nr:YdcF family protein [Bryobacterales bacterium]
MKRLAIGAAALSAALFLLILPDWWIRRQTAAFVYSELEAVPARPVGLVLGTARRVADGRDNLFFRFRMEAAARLYHAGKIRYILVSGDHGTKYYDEPGDMREALLALGVPDAAIVRDYAGFRTLDSVVRCQRVFGVSSVIVISQRFHNERAVYIARRQGMDAVGFNARGVAVSSSPLVYAREYLARAMAMVDVHVLRRQPRFLGERVRIG